jgi:alpha-L-fucosidase
MLSSVYGLTGVRRCVPEQGDWYAREMYRQGNPKYEYHCKTYGHPSKVGFMQIDHMWKAERWQPEQLMDLYVKTGAKYFMALACHHDNLDAFGALYIMRLCCLSSTDESARTNDEQRERAMVSLRDRE